MPVQPDASLAAQTALDARGLSRLRWRCRRGLLENDLFIERFFAHHAAHLTVSQANGLQALMDLPDNDLLDLLLARREPQGDLAQPEVLGVLAMLRVPGCTPAERRLSEQDRRPQGPLKVNSKEAS